jgi:phospholipid/cholesterol/gamma-HCH transport system substrate-binding protein
MATKTVKVKVGVFLVMCLSLIAAALAYISGTYTDQGIPYWLEFEDSVLGVYEGGIVQYLGVPVGKVTNISVTPLNQAHIEISIDPTKIKLHGGVQGQLVMYSLAAGTMAIELSGGVPEQGPLPPGSQIPARPSAFASISTKVEELMEDVSVIVGKVEEGLSGMEPGALNNILKRVDTILADAEGLAGEAKATLEAARGTMETLEGKIEPVTDEVIALSQNIQATSTEAGAFLSVAREKTAQLDVQALGAKLDTVLEQLAELTVQLNSSVANLDSSSATMLHEADNIEFSFRNTLSTTAETLLELESLISQLKQDPSSLVRGKARIKE